MTSAETLELSPVPPPPAPNRSRRRTIGVLAVLVVATVVLLGTGILHSLNFFDTVDQVLSNRAKIGTEVIRLEGLVKPGTIARTSSGASFVLTGSKGEVDVYSSGTPPQLFQADIPVVVVGHFTTRSSLVFDGTQILVKHTATYIAQHPNRVKAPNGTTR